LNEFASTLPEGAKVAIEALTSGIFVYEYLDGKRIEVHLAHPVYVKPFAKKHVKTDKVDARVLAQLLRMDYLPESYVPGEDIRDLRTIVRHRASFVRLRTSIKNKVHALLAIEGVQPPKVSDLIGFHNALLALSELGEIERFNKPKSFVSYAGFAIGFHNALLALSELGEIERFNKPKSFVSYAGFAPKVEQSGDYTRYGHINKHSNGFLRWALIQSTRAAVHSATPNRFQRIYNRLKARRGEMVAIVATARHMAESVYWVLTKKESYKE
jgi:transposase